MIKKELSFLTVDDFNEEVERTVVVRFLYSLKAIKNYELRTGRLFFEDNQKATKAFSNALLEIGVDQSRELTETEQIKLLPMLMEAGFMNFLLDAIPCFYVEFVNGVSQQSEETIERAEESMWISELLDIQFYMELLTEINRHRLKVPQDRKKPQAKS